MNYCSSHQTNLQTLLVVNKGQTELDLNSPVLASFHQVCISSLATTKIITLVQQHQPDLVILDLEWLEAVDSQLIPALRLDWLTRNIPILLITDTSGLQSLQNLDYDVRLHRSCSLLELEKTICFLTSISVCESHGKAV